MKTVLIENTFNKIKKFFVKIKQKKKVIKEQFIKEQFKKIKKNAKVLFCKKFQVKKEQNLRRQVKKKKNKKKYI